MNEALSVAVDYSQSLNQMIDAGKYDEIHPDITPRNFRLTGAGYRAVELRLVEFEDGIALWDAVTLMKREGCRPGTIEELLALGSSRPELQRKKAIVALGSVRVVNNRRYMPALGGSNATRILTLAVIYSRWSRFVRYLFVRE